MIKKYVSLNRLQTFKDKITETIPTKLSELENDKGFVTEIEGGIIPDNATISSSGLMSASDKAKLDNTNVGFGTCITESSISDKIIEINANTNWKLEPGSIVSIKFHYTNTAKNPTFNVNNTGAKSVYYNTSIITTGNLAYAGYANRIATYIYDGNQFVFTGWSVCMTYTNASLGQGFGTCITDSDTIEKKVTLSSYSLTIGGIVVVKFTNSVPSNATLNINNRGAKPIYYKGSAIISDVIKTGDIATFIYDGSQYILLFTDRDDSIVGITINGEEIPVDYTTRKINISLSISDEGDLCLTY